TVAVGVAVAVAVGVGEDVGVGVGLGEAAQYLPPVFKVLRFESRPAQTIISLPVQTAGSALRAEGALVVLVAVQLSVLGLYLPPVLKNVGKASPPQTIISLPVEPAGETPAGGAVVEVVGVQIAVSGLFWSSSF